MKTNRNLQLRLALWTALALTICPAIQGQSWQTTVGAQSKDKGTQALAFLPNEVWIHAGDTVTWTFATDEPHTVSFLKPGQVRPPLDAGCPGTTPSGSSFNGTICVNSGRVTTLGETYSVTFPKPGNYRLVCLVHVNMTGIVHVLEAADPLPHDQGFYNKQAGGESQALLTDVEVASIRTQVIHKHADSESLDAHSHSHEVVTGGGEMVSTAGGFQSVSRMRFMSPTITIHAGETVEWFSDDVSGHTITFGQEPPNPTPATPPSANVFLDPDGARHAIITSTSDNVHSGFIAQAPQERTGLAQAPAGVTRFRVTFKNAGTYPYICAFHDDIGMKGEVIVLP